MEKVTVKEKYVDKVITKEIPVPVERVVTKEVPVYIDKVVDRIVYKEVFVDKVREQQIWAHACAGVSCLRAVLLCILTQPFRPFGHALEFAGHYEGGAL